jgi:MoaA/NifB/PqqE/SkfB family radical SAM enzyme
MTKEGIPFAEHTLRVVNHAANKGMATNVITNGDYVTRDYIKALKKAGLDSLSFSLHTYSKAGLNHLMAGARMAAEEAIIPTVTAVFTSKRAEQFPGIAAEVARNGVLFGFGIVQEKGGGFSTIPKEGSLIPSVDQQKEVFRALLRLKTFGMVRNNRRYMNNIPEYPNNSWTCNPDTDTFIHLGAEGKINVCTDVRTNFTTADIPLLSESQDWRDIKEIKVQNCGDCTYSCYFEAQNQDVVGDLPMLGVMAIIKSGNAHLAEKWGQFAVDTSKRLEKSVNWNLNI